MFATGVGFLLAAPGPTNTLLAIGGSQRGFTGSLSLLAAELAGYVIAIATIHTVLQPILVSFPVIGLICKISFAIFIVYLALRIWRSSNLIDPEASIVTSGSLFVTTLTNPKAFGFALVLLPFDSPDIFAFLGLFGLLVVLTGSVWVAVGVFAIHAFGQSAQRILARIAALVLVGFGVVILNMTLAAWR